ncbi:MAG: hypothetical protein KGJ07_00180 [Patescibacteria group bacterium]|nr:hypothetical protein [Patescibacteria group bacterium]
MQSKSKVVYSEALTHQWHINKHEDGTWSTNLVGEFSQKFIKSRQVALINKTIRDTASMLEKLRESK